MSRDDRTAARLLLWYPPAWRERYGEEMTDLITSMGRGCSRVSWRVRADVALGGLRERARAVTAIGLLVWAAASFGLGALVLGKASEHWRAALPASGRAAASAAFITMVIAGAAAAVVVTALALRLARTAAADLTRPAVRRRLLIAVLTTTVLGVATAGLVSWAHRLGADARQGADARYAAGYVAWGVLIAACAATWAWTATELVRRAARPSSRLCAVVASAMAAGTLAAIAWWTSVAFAADVSAPEWAVGVGLMLAGTALATGAARRRPPEAVPSRG